MNSEEKIKTSDVKVLKDKKHKEYNIHTGWKQEWVSPKQLNSKKPIKICEVVRGPFYSPKLLKISPFVSFSSPQEESGKMTMHKEKIYGGIPDPWNECLAIKGYCNNNQAEILRKSCVSRCMRFWITKTVWKEMGLPLIQGIPDPGRDYSYIEKTYKRRPLKRQKRDASDTLPRSKSLPDSLEKNSIQKNLTFSNTVPSSNLVDENKNEDIDVPKISNQQMNKKLGINKNDRHRSNKSNKTESRKSGGGNFNIKTNSKRSDRVYCYSPLDIGTQTTVDGFERIPCQDSSLQAILKMAKNSILPRKTYRALKERWTRMKELSSLENTNGHFSRVRSCRCKRVNNFKTKIQEEEFDKLPADFVHNYCARCKRHILKNETFHCRCHDYSRYKTQENENTKRFLLKKNQNPIQENSMIQTDIGTVKELQLVCSRCNYPYLKTNAEIEINPSKMDYLVDRNKNRTFVNNTNDDMNHRFPNKRTENKSTVPASSLRSTSKWDNLKFTCGMEHGYCKDVQDMKYVKADVEKTRWNVKERSVNTKKTRENYDVETTKEKIPDERHDFSMEYKEFISSDSGIHADVSDSFNLDQLGDFSSVTSDTYLDRLNKSLISSKKYRNINTNKSKTIVIDRTIKQSSPFSASRYNKSVSLQEENEKVINKKVDALNDRNYEKEKKNKRKDYVKLPKKRSRSKTKSKRELTSKSTVKRKSRSKSKSKGKSKLNTGSKTNSKSPPKNQFKSKSRSKSRSRSRSKSRSRSRSKTRSRSRSKSRSRSRSKSISRSRSKSRSQSRSKSEPESKSRYIRTQSKVQSLKTLRDSTIITKHENSNLKEKNVKPGSKDASSSMTGVLFDSGPCITRNCFMQETTCNYIIDSDNSVCSSIRNFYRSDECESKKFQSRVSLPKSNLEEQKKKHCWLSKSDNYMNSSERQRENRIKNLACRKSNDCYLRYCNSRFVNSARSVSDESSNIMYMNSSNKK